MLQNATFKLFLEPLKINFLCKVFLNEINAEIKNEC